MWQYRLFGNKNAPRIHHRLILMCQDPGVLICQDPDVCWKKQFIQSTQNLILRHNFVSTVRGAFLCKFVVLSTKD